MVQTVKLEDGTFHTFPNEATPDQIEGALKTEAARQQFINLTKNGLSDAWGAATGNFDRVSQRVGSDAWGALKGIGNTVLQGVPSLLNQAVAQPTQALKNVGAGLSSIPFNIGNAILNTPQYVAGLESDRASNFLKKYTPEIPTEGIVNANWGNPGNQSDIDVRNLASNAPVLFPGARMGASAASGIVRGAGSKILGKTDAALEANEALLGNKVQDKSAEVDQKVAAANAAKEANQQAISFSQQETGKSNPDLMQYDVNNRQQAIQNMTDDSNELQNQLANTKPAETDLPEAEENLSRSQENVQNSQNMLSDIDSNISQYLNPEANHAVKTAQGLSHRIPDIEDYWKDSYKTFQSNIADANFQMPKTAMENLDYDSMSPNQLIKTFGNDAFEALKKGKMDEFIQKQKAIDASQSQGDNPYFQTLMEVAPTASDTNAADFLAKYKDFGDREFNLSRRLSDPRVEEVEKQKMQAALTQARQMKSQMKDVLDAGLGEFKPEFERVNKGYSEQVHVLRGNKYVENYKGKSIIRKLPDNIIKAFSTDEEGMPLMRELVKQDPELLRNVVGQRYFSGEAGRNSIYNPNETMREYLDEMPELKQLLSQREKANSALEQSKSNAELAKQHHAEISARQADAEKMQTKIDKMQSDIEVHKNKITKLQANIDTVKKTTQQENITLKDMMQSQKELKDLNRQLKEETMKLDQKTTGLRKLWRIAKTTYRIGKYATLGK